MQPMAVNRLSLMSLHPIAVFKLLPFEKEANHHYKNEFDLQKKQTFGEKCYNFQVYATIIVSKTQ